MTELERKAVIAKIAKLAWDFRGEDQQEFTDEVFDTIRHYRAREQETPNDND